MSDRAPSPTPRRVSAASRARSRTAVLGALLLVASAGCGAPPAPADGVGAASRPRVWRPATPDTLGPILAIVGWHAITRHQVDSLLATAPPSVQQQYRSSPDQYRQLVERLVDTEVLHQAALRDSIDQDSLLQAELAGRIYELRIKHYYRRRMVGAPEPSDSQVAAAYEDRAKEFDMPGRVRVKHILYATQEKARAGRRRFLKGTAWDSLCARESKDARSAKNGGLLGYVATDSDLVPGIGKAPAIAAAAFALQEGAISEPVKSEKGWHLVAADDAHAPYRRPLAEVRNQLATEIKSQMNEQFTKALFDSLKHYSGVTVFDDSISTALHPARTPQELFEQAQAAGIANDRISLYRQLVKQYPKERVSEQAAFMIGFTYAEELADYGSARTAFDDFIRDFPQSDLVKSARWMLENMEKPSPDLDGESPPGQGGPESGD